MHLKRQITSPGPKDAKIVFVDACPGWDEIQDKQPLAGFTGRFFTSLMRQADLKRSECRFESVIQCFTHYYRHWELPTLELEMWKADLIERLQKLKPNIIVPIGELPLNVICDLKSISKWHLSLVHAVPGLDNVKCCPILDPRTVQKTYKHVSFLIFGLQRIADESRSAEMPTFKENFVIRPSFMQAMDWIKEAQDGQYLGVDIETCQCQISCVGLCTDTENAISIPTLPGDWNRNQTFEIFKALDALLQKETPKKILQNFLYDYSYFSKYGVTASRCWHDTMLAQKFIYPELPMGLDTIARIWTKRPYWKDEGSDWRKIIDWDRHYRYNCKDAVGTYESAFGQRRHMVQSGKCDLFDNYIMALTEPVREMCARGLPLDEKLLLKMRKDVNERIKGLTEKLDERSKSVCGKTINPRSPKQVKDLLQTMKIRLPTRQGKITTDKKALKQLAIKYPKESIFKTLLDLSKYQKQKSSYLEFKYDEDKRLRYSINTHGTETGRFSCNKSPFDRGLNAQTIPKYMRGMFKAPDGFQFIQVDLKQAESRFIAWDAPEPKLIQMYSDNIDIHRFVAARLFDILPADVNSSQRSLGKKIGHGSNYGMAPKTFAVTCLDEIGLRIDEAKAHTLLEGYHELFPGIRKWHKKIESQLHTNNKILETPIGRRRQFFGRLDEDLFREAYAYRPQSTVPDVINHLMLHLFGKTKILLQVHDSLLLEVEHDSVDNIIEIINDLAAWHPVINLEGGKLTIPIEIEVGHSWGSMQPI